MGNLRKGEEYEVTFLGNRESESFRDNVGFCSRHYQFRRLRFPNALIMVQLLYRYRENRW